MTGERKGAMAASLDGSNGLLDCVRRKAVGEVVPYESCKKSISQIRYHRNFTPV